MTAAAFEFVSAGQGMIQSRQKTASIVVLVISVAGLLYYTATNWPSFQRLSIVSPLYVIPFMIALFLNYAVLAMIMKVLTQSLGLKLGISEAFLLSIMTSFHNMVLPFRGGMGTRALYLKKRYNYAYTSFLATVSAGYVLMFLVASGLGLATLIYSYTSLGIVSGVLFLVFSGIVSLLVIVVLFSPRVRSRNNEWLNRVGRVINSWALIREDRSLILVTTVLSMLQMLLETAGVFLQFQVFGLHVPFVKCIFLASVGSLGQVLQITPAGLGVNEALVVFSAQAIGVTPTETLAATLLGRAVQSAVLIALGPIASYWLVRDGVAAEST